MNVPRISVKIEADFSWDSQAEDTQTEMLRHQSQHVLNAMALDLENVVRDILQQMIFHRAKLDG